MGISAARVLALVIAVAAIVFAFADRSGWTRFWAEQGIYSEIVAIVNQSHPGKELLVRSRPTDCTAHVFRWDELDALSNLNGLTQETLTSYLDANGEHALTTNFWRLRQDAEVLDEGDILRLVPEKPYGTFSLIGYVPAGQVLVSLSRAGLDTSLQQALVCVEIVTGRAGGSGILMLFSMNDGEWVIEDALETW